MIIIGENDKLALLNDTFVHEGSKVNGNRVHKIEDSAVVLKSATGETRISFSQFSFTSPIGRSSPDTDDKKKKKSAGSLPSKKEMALELKKLIKESEGIR